MTATKSSFSFEPGSQTDLTGRILPARIKKVRLDSCELDLLDERDHSVIASGRLYQAGSLAWRDSRLLKDIPDYQPGIILEKVYAQRPRYEEGQGLWYVQERWGQDNPWTDLALAVDDIITGTVIRDIVSAKSGEHAGYLVQLDVGAPIRVSDSGVLEPSDRSQPDIEVFLPDEELPWADGGLDTIPENTRIGRMSLMVGDAIQGMVREIRMPPLNPVVSLSRFIHSRDTTAEKAFRHENNMARWHFRRLLGEAGETASSEEDVTPEFTPGDRPYAGKRFLLVEDNPATLAAQSELLSLMGAHVHAIEVRPGGFGGAIHDAITVLEENDFDIALIDNNLPGKDLGRNFVRQVSAQLTNRYPVCFVLISADPGQIPTRETREKLRENGVKGFVQRPLTHIALQQLLAGTEIWEDAGRRTNADRSARYLPSATLSPTVEQILDDIAGQAGIHFALLVRASRRIDPPDFIAAGNAPFQWDDITNVVGKTDLHLLIDGRIGALDVIPGEGGNNLLRTGQDNSSHWKVLNLGNARWIFGVGHVSDKDIQDQLSIWHSALGAAMDAQGWQAWARHISGFVQLGLAHQGLSHEVIHLQSEFSDLLFLLDDRIRKLESGAVLKKRDKDFLADKLAALTRSKTNLLEFSRHQLHEQAMRHREVFLPDAVAAIWRIANCECQEGEVALHVADPPPLALPLPNAALVLPVINLLLNAIKHHYRRENRRAELLFGLKEQEQKHWLVIDVRDNGPGLAQTAVERLWQPGFSGAADVEERHGIGLWLSRQLVEGAGGTLELYENWRGIGACFRLCFPIHLG
uniref:histidine kinase n=1 Tax=Candidatus Kentrum sp. DK TaxID=2126562 RepID=A0A450SST4_9GAMM|nr:MAG: Histidine kinase-, DNA gyrase B-, and HSP90-like ATPase [Candidatus Kentron sp. DK]